MSTRVPALFIIQYFLVGGGGEIRGLGDERSHSLPSLGGPTGGEENQRLFSGRGGGSDRELAGSKTQTICKDQVA